jgi:hypothetical protein
MKVSLCASHAGDGRRTDALPFQNGQDARALRRARYTLLNTLLKTEPCKALYALGYVDFLDGLRV